MTYHSLEKIIKKNRLKVDLDLLKLAYDFSREAHSRQKRFSGEMYFQHPLRTSYKLAELGLDEATILAGLLHDVPEDTPKSLEDVEKNFGTEVARLVEGVTKLGRIKYRGIKRYVENLRKMFVAMATDIRVIFIKFADRINNLKTLQYLPEKKQKRIALETIDIYAPIAHRLGMGEIKGELEDLAFRYAYPEDYRWASELVKKTYPESKKYINRVKNIVKKELEKKKVKVIDIHGRAKHLFSLWQKLVTKDKDINKIHDFVALRIIVSSIPDCYAALGFIHKKWKPLKGQIKDYISTPKPNGYRSLHTTVFCEKQIVEFQIRTPKMHEEAEFGVASHWHYTESGKPKIGSKVPKDKIAWLLQLTKIQKEIKDGETYLDSLKLDVFQKQIFVFTPKGDVIDLPENSTPVDFAYQIHTEVGNKCTGAKINEQMSNLDTKLKSGDLVEILVDKKRGGPSRDWLSFVQTLRAKEKIRHALARQKKKSIFRRFFLS